MENTYTKEGTDFTVNYDEVGENHFIRAENQEGKIFRQVINWYRVILTEQRIEVAYLDQALWSTGEVITSSPVTFDATTQESWSYFKSLTRTAERDVQMMLNGISISRGGPVLFDQAGNFIAESDEV